MKRCISCKHSFISETWTCPNCGFSPAIRGEHPAFAPDLADENDGMIGSAHEALNELQAGNFWFRARNRLILQLARKHFPGAGRIIEVGCGTGYVLAGLREEFPDASLVGSEIYSSALDDAKKRLRNRGEFIQMDVREIPFEDEFDLMCAFDVIEHVSEDGLVLEQMFNATKRGGGILLSVPQHPFLWSPIDDYSHHKRRYRRHELEAKCIQAGFTVVQTTSFVSTLLPLMAVQRLMRSRHTEIDPAAELKISGPLNKALEAVLDAERIVIAAGLSLPVGGSRFVVARKH